MAVKTHERHLGRAPRGIWSPECGYRPAGEWAFPVANADESPTPAPTARIGVEQAFAESGLRFFTVDSHLVEGSALIASPYQLSTGHFDPAPHAAEYTGQGGRSLYQTYTVDGPYLAQAETARPVAVFPRDPRTGVQVWSGELGYPGDGNYLDFHKKRWPGGHRYWKVTGPRVDIGDKQPYLPQEAAARVQGHAAHFANLVHTALTQAQTAGQETPPVLCAPFDAELFGHWWFEGPLWLEAVVRTLHQYPTGIEMISGSAYLDRYGEGPAAYAAGRFLGCGRRQ